MNVLVIEDESKILRLLELELSHEGYTVDLADNGRIGLEKALRGTWDIILLDLMLPGLDGLDVLRGLRAADPYTPVILLTAKKSTPDKVTGLDQGANDYLVKPFEIDELLARMRSCIRSRQLEAEAAAKPGSRLLLRDLVVDKLSRDVTRGGKTIELTPKEYDLLVYLLENKGQVLERGQIINQVWGYDFMGDSNIVDVYVRYLRKKIETDEGEPMIQTIRGVGYRMRKNFG